MGPACRIRPSQTAASTTRASLWTPRPRRTPRPRPSPPRPFLAAQYPTRSPPPSLAHSQHPDTRRTAHAPMELHYRPPWSRACSTATIGSQPCPFPGELCIDASNPGHPSVRPFPLYFTPRTHQTFTLQPKPHHRQPEASSCPCRRSSAPEPSLKVTKLPMPLISHSLPLCVRNCSPEQGCAVAMPLHRRPPPSSAFAPVLCPRPRPSCHPEPSRALPSALRPPAWPLSRLR
jgi:hypothetical protein